MLNYHRPICILAFIISAMMVFGRLGELPLTQPDEERNAEVAREMHQSGAWLVPTYNGLAYLDKPAFFFKTVALSFSAFGESAGAARLPSAVFGFALLTVLFLFCKREYDGRTAALAVIVVATTPLYVVLSRFVIFDMTLAFFVCSAIFASYIAEAKEGRSRSRWYLIAAAAAGTATLVKGPIGFIIPTLVIWIFNRVDGRKGAMRRFFAPSNLLLFCAIVLPWFVGVALIRPDFPYYGVIRESLLRFTTTEFHRTGPFYYYAPVIAGSFFAWSILLPESVLAAWRWRERWSRADRLFIVWAIVVVLFFSLSQSKLPAYVLTAVVALGALAARLFVGAFRGENGRAARIVLRGAAALALLCAAASLLLAVGLFKPGTLPLLGIESPKLRLLAPGFAPVIGSLIFVALLACAALMLRDSRVAFAAFLVFPLLLMTVSFSALSLYAGTRSGHALAERIPALPENTEIACYECFPSALPFYLKRYVTILSKDGDELRSNYITFTLAKTQPWPKVIVPLAECEHWLAKRDHPIYLLARRSRVPALDSLAALHKVTSRELTGGYWAALFPALTGN